MFSKCVEKVPDILKSALKRFSTFTFKLFQDGNYFYIISFTLLVSHPYRAGCRKGNFTETVKSYHTNLIFRRKQNKHLREKWKAKSWFLWDVLIFFLKPLLILKSCSRWNADFNHISDISFHGHIQVDTYHFYKYFDI